MTSIARVEEMTRYRVSGEDLVGCPRIGLNHDNVNRINTFRPGPLLTPVIAEKKAIAGTGKETLPTFLQHVDRRIGKPFDLPAPSLSTILGPKDPLVGSRKEPSRTWIIKNRIHSTLVVRNLKLG